MGYINLIWMIIIIRDIDTLMFLIPAPLSVLLKFT